jgi:chromatin segregation and condensation protein Rec8/ScpA/Scc1 (kleisin family)
MFTDIQYKPTNAHDLESIIKLLYHAINQENVDQCDVDVCQLNDVIAW